MKVITLVYLTFLLSNRLLAQSDIRNSRWGMTIDEVVKSEGRIPDKEDVGYYQEKELIYDFSVDSRILRCTFIFTNNRLSGVTYRYSWGEWQNATNYSFSTRFSSISNLFKTLKQKKYKSRYGWHILNELYTSRGNDLSNCLGSDKYINELYNVDMAKIEDCYNKHSDFGKNGNSYAQIDFESERTRAIVKFPLKNHPFKAIYIGWVDFKAKSGLKNEF